MVQATRSRACHSLSALWAAAVSPDDTIASNSPDVAPEPAPLSPADLTAYARTVGSALQEWAGLFSQVAPEHKRRKEALAGAVKIKSAGKRFEKVVAELGTAQSAEDGVEGTAKEDADAGSEGVVAPASAPPLVGALQESQAIFRDSILGLLDVSFPVEEFIALEDFKNTEGFSAAVRRMQCAAGCTAELARLFAAAKVDPKPTAGDSSDVEPPLPPEIAKMLEKAKKQKDKNGSGSGLIEINTTDMTAAKAEWAQTDGQCSCVLGEEIWEGLCWRRGSFLFRYIFYLLEDRRDDTTAENATAEATADATPRAQPLSRALLADAMRCFWMMLNAQGPIAGDHDDPALWKFASDGPHEDETARMFYHGVYSSSHLRALKHLCELAYWQWKHMGQRTADAELAALLNRKFVHVVRHIMPGSGWTADVEYERIVEMEAATLNSSSFSAGLNEKRVLPNSNFKGAVAADSKKNKASKARAGGNDNSAGDPAAPTTVAAAAGAGGSSNPDDAEAAAGAGTATGTGNSRRKKKSSQKK